jgi:hypothetical protein
MTAMDYEILIRRAFKCDRYGHQGADTDIWTSLATAEYRAKEPKATQKIKDKYKKELEKVKKFVGRAFDAAEKELIKREDEPDKIVEIKSLKIACGRAKNTNELSRVIREGLDRFIDYEIKMGERKAKK